MGRLANMLLIHDERDTNYKKTGKANHVYTKNKRECRDKCKENDLAGRRKNIQFFSLFGIWSFQNK